MTRRRWVAWAGSLGVVLMTPVASLAIFGIADTAIVQDPLNLVQNTWSAARSLVSNQNEARQILEQVRQIAQDAKHLVAMPLNTLNELQAAWQQYTALLQQGQGTLAELKGTVAQFEALYASGWGGDRSMMARAKALLQKVRDVGTFTARVDNLYGRLGGQQQRVQRLILASQAAPGSLAAQQATNQLLGTLADQGASLQLLLAAQNEVQTSWIMSQVVGAEQAAAVGLQQQIDPSRYLRLGPGMGQGKRLP